MSVIGLLYSVDDARMMQMRRKLYTNPRGESYLLFAGLYSDHCNQPTTYEMINMPL